MSRVSISPIAPIARIAALLVALVLAASFALAQAPPAPDPTLTAQQQKSLDDLFKQARQAYAETDFGAAEKILERALDMARLLKSQLYMARCLSNLGTINLENGEYDKALELSSQALECMRKVGDPHGTAICINNVGLVYASLGQYDNALDCYRQAIALRTTSGISQDVGETYSNIGSLYNAMGQFDKALDFDNRALEVFKQLKLPRSIADTLNNLGNVCDFLGQYDRALVFHNQALDIRRVSSTPRDVGMSLNNIGNVYVGLNDGSKALEYLTQALEIRQKLPNVQNIASTLNNTGNAYVLLGQPEKALDFFNRALEIRRKAGNPQRLASCLSNIGNTYRKLGQLDKALEASNQALEIRRKLSNLKETAMSLHDVGLTYRDMNQLEKAEGAFAECRRLRESLVYQIGDPSQVGVLQDTFGQFYAAYAQLMLDRKRPEDGLEMLESGRGQGLARQIDLNERGDLTRLFTEDERKTLRRNWDQLNMALNRLRQAQRHSEISPPERRAEAEQQVAALQKREQEAEQEYTLLRDALFARYPDLKRIAQGQPAFFSQLKALARDHPDTLYLEYGIIDEKTSLLFTLASDGLHVFTLPVGSTALKEMARRWRSAIDFSGGRGVEDINSLRHTNTQAEPELAKQAYRALLRDAEKAGLLQPGRYKRMVIVPSGPMLELPFAALCDSRGHRLIEKYTISHAISLSVFFWRSNPLLPSASLIAIADPVGRSPDPPAAAKTKSAIATNNSIANRGADDQKSLFRAGFGPLPGARQEGAAVARTFAGSKLLVGPAANEEAVLRLLPSYAVLHFATHGFVAPGAALSSGLVLAEEPAEGKYDGLLTARKIMNVALSARMAVLSACDTGRGMAQGGEGLLGLAWAFRAAGCPALVASQWHVDDAATERWMVTFYEALKAGKRKDDAVQKAMIAGMKQNSSPYYWAAFELVGDTGALPNPLVRRNRNQP